MSASGLNMALTDLRSRQVREQALLNLESYLEGYDLTYEERQAILQRDWAKIWQLGASTYTMNKLRHISRLDHDELWTVWRGGHPEDFEKFLEDQDRKNAPFAYPVEEIV